MYGFGSHLPSIIPSFMRKVDSLVGLVMRTTKLYLNWLGRFHKILNQDCTHSCKLLNANCTKSRLVWFGYHVYQCKVLMLANSVSTSWTVKSKFRIESVKLRVRRSRLNEMNLNKNVHHDPKCLDCNHYRGLFDRSDEEVKNKLQNASIIVSFKGYHNASIEILFEPVQLPLWENC